MASLESAKQPSLPWCEGGLPSCDIGLEIDGAGRIELPLRPAGFRKLCEIATQAPYGKGTETIIDTSVRNTLEVDGEMVTYSHEFADAIQDAVKWVAEQLQLDVQRLRVDLYKLLIYTKGGFFLPHRDSEKRPGMVATMIVVLPSSFGGGELCVNHQLLRHVFLFDQASGNIQPQFAAFFADCQHEVHRVTSGVRVCLAFNLILDPQRKESKDDPGMTADPELMRHLRDWMHYRPSDPLVFALEHQYTEAGLKSSLLKGADKELLRHIATAADTLDCHLHLGQVSRHLTQFADEGCFYNERRRYRGYDSDWSGDYKDLTIGETYDDEIVIDGWKDADGEPVRFAGLACQTSQLISAAPVEDWKPTRQDYEGYTGNAGNTLERWYHKSAIVIWPRAQHYKIIADMGLEFAVGELLRMRDKRVDGDEADRDQANVDCQRLAEMIIDHWPNRQHVRSVSDQQGEPWLQQFAMKLPTIVFGPEVCSIFSPVGDSGLEHQSRPMCRGVD
ncbi:MAG: 2OG-Fe(II) oxygenase [Pirellulaceae bacterium]